MCVSVTITVRRIDFGRWESLFAKAQSLCPKEFRKIQSLEEKVIEICTTFAILTGVD